MNTAYLKAVRRAYEADALSICAGANVAGRIANVIRADAECERAAD